MARMPGAVWKPLPRPSSTKMARYDLVVIHTMVGSLAGTDGYFRGLTNGVNSHFGTGGAGEIWQWVDTAVRSGANGAGNHRAITIENADMGPGFASWNTGDSSAVPAFTAAQIEANAAICAWAHLEHDVPLEMADTSRPNARGIGFHRLGCDPYRVPDGEKWSSSYGKVCPAPRRIAQIPQIIARAKQLVAGTSAADTIPTPQISEDDDMIAYSTVDTKRGYLQQGLDFWWEGDGETYDTCKQAAGGVAIQINQRQADVLGAALGQKRAALIADVAKLTSGGKVDVDALAAAVARLVPDNVADLTAEKMKDAAKAGLVEVLTTGTDA